MFGQTEKAAPRRGLCLSTDSSERRMGDRGEGRGEKIAIILQKITYEELITTLLEFMAHTPKKRVSRFKNHFEDMSYISYSHVYEIYFLRIRELVAIVLLHHRFYWFQILKSSELGTIKAD